MGVTPLHLTALNNHPHLARYLGYARADKNLCAKKPGSTPLMMAVSWRLAEHLSQKCQVNAKACAFIIFILFTDIVK